MTLSYPPLEYQRLDRDFPAELDGQFRVMHMPPKEFDWSWNKPDVTPLSAVSERPLRWLWDKKIPLGKLTLIEGPPGVGKLYAALDLAARITTGALVVENEPVLMPTAEQEERLRANWSGQGADGASAQTQADSQASLKPRASNLNEASAQTEVDSQDQANASGAPWATAYPYPTDDPPPVLYVRPADYVPPPPDPPASDGRPVVIVCDKWEAEDMILPRLKTLGVREDRVGIFTEVHCTDLCLDHPHDRKIKFPLDRMMFKYILRKHRRCKLIVIDNLEEYCDTPQQMRRAIKELDESAAYFNVAIVATVQGNVRVAQDGTIRDTARTADSLARSIWCITPDPSHPGLLRFEPKRMAFCKKPEGIAFRITDAGQVVWEPLPPYEKPPTEAAQRKRLQHTRLLTWLTATLGTGVVSAKTIYDAGKEEGFSKNKLIAARQELGARTYKFGFGDAGGWLWTFKPEAEVTEMESQDAYFGKLEGFRFDPGGVNEGEPGASAPGWDGAGQTGEERRAKGEGRRSKREARNREKNGVLSGNGRKTAGYEAKATEATGANRLPELDPECIRELAKRMVRDMFGPEQAEQELARRHGGNGHAGNGHAANGHTQENQGS